MVVLMGTLAYRRILGFFITAAAMVCMQMPGPENTSFFESEVLYDFLFVAYSNPNFHFVFCGRSTILDTM